MSPVPSPNATAPISTIRSKPPASIRVKTTFSQTDSEMPTKLMRVKTRMNASATSRVGSWMNSARYRPPGLHVGF